MNEEWEAFDGEAAAEAILQRHRRTMRMWRGVYRSLGKEFELREPTAEEMLQAIQIEADRYKDAKSPKKPPKKPPKLG